MYTPHCGMHTEGDVHFFAFAEQRTPYGDYLVLVWAFVLDFFLCFGRHPCSWVRFLGGWKQDEL
jgi:hypothetical protein